jgi:hypothetical protein
LVLAGRVRDRRFAVTTDPGGDRRLYEAGYVDDESVLRRTEQSVRCAEEESSTWLAGDIYDVPSAAFHASESEVPSITLAETGTPIDRAPLVIGELDDKRLVRYRRRELTTVEFAGVLREVWSPARP